MARLAQRAITGAYFGLLFGETFACLLAARLVEKGLPFRWLAPWLGRPNAESGATASTRDDARARGVARVIAHCAERLPWHSSCMVRALAAHAMLCRRRLAHTLYLGAMQHAGETEAHAWLRCGSVMVSGADVPGTLTPVTRYAWARPS